jgi:glycerophosphoryl diester phosphodiesterase
MAVSSFAANQRPLTVHEFMKMGSRTRVIAHRGFSGNAPENTLAAIRQAISVGADMVEVDVTVTADGHVILLHDETLDRTTNGKGPPFESSLDDIKKLDAGSWFDPRYEGETVPTLVETLETVKGLILINIEIKAEAVEFGVVRKVAGQIVTQGMLDQVVVSSFSPDALRQMKATNPAIITASLFNKELHIGRDPLEILREVDSQAFNISSKRLTVAMVERCHRQMIPVAVYTVNEPEEMRRVMGMGVDAIFTDYPDQMLEIVAELQGPPP